jgi:hypothetical protein
MWVVLLMAGEALECGNPHVADLLTFVAARLEEDRSDTSVARRASQGRAEILGIVKDVLLPLARESCRAEMPCALPDRYLRALGEYAFLHRSHPDYHPAWLGWRLLP